jgi:hypothetical protein
MQIFLGIDVSVMSSASMPAPAKKAEFLGNDGRRGMGQPQQHDTHSCI